MVTVSLFYYYITLIQVYLYYFSINQRELEYYFQLIEI